MLTSQMLYDQENKDSRVLSLKESTSFYLELLQSRKAWFQNSKKHRLHGNKSWYYNEYLVSNHWQGLRAAKLAQAGYCCEHCKTTCEDTTLDVHHKTYEHLGFEPLGDLEVLCRRCHLLQHAQVEK